MMSLSWVLELFRGQVINPYLLSFPSRLLSRNGVFFRAVFHVSGGFRPPPATLAMVAGGGGRNHGPSGARSDL